MSTEPSPPRITRATLIDLQTAHAHAGPQVGHEIEDLNLTLLRWKAGQGVTPHINTEVDVVLIVTEGEGEVMVDDQKFELGVGQALLIPKNCERAVSCVGEAFAYLSVHKRRRGLMPTVRTST